MNKPLIIDNNILEISSPYTKEILNKADVDLRDYDVFVSGKVYEIFEKHSDCDCVVLPFSLDENRYSNYTGIIVALHIRLTAKLGRFSRLPIIFVGPDANHIDQVARLSIYGGFLFTPLVFWRDVKNSDELDSYLVHISSLIGGNIEMTDGMYKTFLSSIKVESTAKYGSRHSIANEWCRYRWMNAIGEKYDSEIKNQLYFKYCEQLGEFHKGDEKKEKLEYKKVDNTKGKVMLIDDEADKWAPFFKEILNKTDVEHFVSIGGEFNKYPIKDKLIDYVVGQIKDINPDVVLLDLRLHEDDFEKIDKNKLSGNVILDRIKNKINKGIQVIAFSASNKDNSYRDFPYDDVFIKESPEEIITEAETNGKVKKILDSISDHLDKAVFLKKIIAKLDAIDSFVSKDVYSEEFYNYYKTNRQIAVEFLSKRSENPIYSPYAYLQLFLIVERYLQERDVIVEDEGKYYVVVNGLKKEIASWSKNEKGKYDFQYNLIHREGKPSYFELGNDDRTENTNRLETNYKMSATLIYKFGNENSNVKNWPRIVFNRNKKAEVHANDNIKRLTDVDFVDIVVFLEYILNRANCVKTINDFELKYEDIPAPNYKEAEVVLCGRLKQARLIENGRVYEIECKDRLKIGDIILVDVEVSGGNIKKLIYKKRKE